MDTLLELEYHYDDGFKKKTSAQDRQLFEFISRQLEYQIRVKKEKVATVVYYEEGALPKLEKESPDLLLRLNYVTELLRDHYSRRSFCVVSKVSNTEEKTYYSDICLVNTQDEDEDEIENEPQLVQIDEVHHHTRDKKDRLRGIVVL